MRKYKLDRSAQSPDGTLGWLLGEGLPEAGLRTLEEEWRDNARGESRIPAGTYVCRRTVYYRHGFATFEITGVPDRDRILFHPGNTEEDSDGCVLLGMRASLLEVDDEETGERRKKIAVVESRRAFALFMTALAGVDAFELEVTDPEWDI